MKKNIFSIRNNKINMSIDTQEKLKKHSIKGLMETNKNNFATNVTNRVQSKVNSRVPTLKDYQKNVVAFLANDTDKNPRRGLLAFHDVGMGKSITTAACIYKLFVDGSYNKKHENENNKIKRIFIVCPKSIHEKMVSEILYFIYFYFQDGKFEEMNYQDNQDKEKEKLTFDGYDFKQLWKKQVFENIYLFHNKNLYMINDEKLSRAINQSIFTNSFLVVDEAHQFIATQRKFSNAIQYLSDICQKVTKLLLLTATPYEHNEKELSDMLLAYIGILPHKHSDNNFQLYGCRISLGESFDSNENSIEKPQSIFKKEPFYIEYDESKSITTENERDPFGTQFMDNYHEQIIQSIINTIKKIYNERENKEQTKIVVFMEYVNETSGISKVLKELKKQDFYNDFQNHIYSITGQTKSIESVVQNYDKSERAILFISQSASVGIEFKETTDLIFGNQNFLYRDDLQTIGRVIRPGTTTHAKGKYAKVNIWHLIPQYCKKDDDGQEIPLPQYQTHYEKRYLRKYNEENGRKHFFETFKNKLAQYSATKSIKWWEPESKFEGNETDQNSCNWLLNNIKSGLVIEDKHYLLRVGQSEISDEQITNLQNFIKKISSKENGSEPIIGQQQGKNIQVLLKNKQFQNQNNNIYKITELHPEFKNENKLRNSIHNYLQRFQPKNLAQPMDLSE